MIENLNFSIAQINPIVGDLSDNIKKIIEASKEALAKDPSTDVIVFPECVTTGYPIEDLANRPKFVEDVRYAVLNDLLPYLNFHEFGYNDVGIIIGTPWIEQDRYDGKVYNAALFIVDGQIAAIRYKTDLPNYGVFDEQRTFNPATNNKPVVFKNTRIGVMVCQDMWGNSNNVQTVPHNLAKDGVDVFVVINGSPFEVEKDNIRKRIAMDIYKETQTPLIYVNLVGGQDSLVFDGGSFLVDGSYKQLAPQFEEHIESINITSPVKQTNRQIYEALTLGLRDYIRKTGYEKVVLGLSGGVDSTLVATIATDAIGPKNVLGILLPSKYSSDHSVNDALTLASNLGIETRIINIENSVTELRKATRFYKNPKNPELDNMGVTDENLQARARGTLLMAVSNFERRMLLSTGNKSEVSVGYATLYGDMNGGFNPLKDVYKTLVFELCEWRNRNIPNVTHLNALNVIPQNIITKPPSAELSNNQLDTDSLPPYNVLDSWLQMMIDCELPMSSIETEDKEMLRKVRRLVDLAEYKRRQAAPGTKITKRLYGNDRRYPINNHYKEQEND